MEKISQNSKNRKTVKLKYICTKNKEKIRLFGNVFYKENGNKCKMIINNETKDLMEFYIFKDKKKELNVELVINEKLKDMHGMFYECKRLQSVSDLSNIDTTLVKDMSFLFYECSSLEYLSDFSEWNTSKVTNMKYMFYKCKSLKNITGISKWNTSSVTDLSFSFYDCSSLSSLSEISDWNTSSLFGSDYMYEGCDNLKNPPDISKWVLSKVFPKNNINEIHEQNDEFYYFNNPLSKIKEFKSVKNEGLKFLPQIKMDFSGDFKITKELIKKLKNELKVIFGIEDFSIIEINKGSLQVIVSLQYILKKMFKVMKGNPNRKNIENIPKDIENEIRMILDKIIKNNFISIGKCPTMVCDSIFDFFEEFNQKKIENMFKSINNDKTPNKFNIYEHAKNIKLEELENFIDFLSTEAEKQELNQLNKNFENFYETEKQLENAINESIFEYKIINIFLIERNKEEYQKCKNQCPNREIKLLFHGTQPENIPLILENNFNVYSKHHKFGQGSYFTDSLDYVTFYSRNECRKNFSSIPKVNKAFSFIASEIFYDKNEFETEYNCIKKNEKVKMNGIRHAKVNGRGFILCKEKEEDKTKFIANEFLVSHSEQILPMYAISIKRCEYLIIWRDYNFDSNKLKKYGKKLSIKIQKFNEEIRLFSSREVDSKVYYVKNSEEGIDLIKRKKFNKIILITNGKNDANIFIDEARKIIGCNCITLVSSYCPSDHLEWVSQKPNTLISNKKEFHERFIKSIITFNLNEIIELKKDIENYYGKNYPDFKLNNFDFSLPIYPHFKNFGEFLDLKF